MQEIKAAHRKVFAGSVLCYTPHFSKAARKNVFVLLRPAFILQNSLGVYYESSVLLSICGLFAGWGTSSSNYDQAWLQSLALCAGFGWGIENLHLTSIKPAVQSLTLFVLCSGLFDPCPSCTLDEELLKAECALCRSYSVALCNCRVPSHV